MWRAVPEMLSLQERQSSSGTKKARPNWDSFIMHTNIILTGSWFHRTVRAGDGIRLNEASADFILSTAPPRRPYCLSRRGNRGLMQHRKEPSLVASLYRFGPSVGHPRSGMAVDFEDVHDA